MPCLISGYEYDIFISYRQKDNKGDHWVSEFVEALKTELESTFKEEISVYFDINPHDGLLETHDVDASLKEKLKCLIFIPIISRTYCDPKSFAWEHEFKAFVDSALKDPYGLKLKISNGNVANRVLPIRIHDLSEADIKEYESITGSFLRGIEFIYKEAGVNRPLRWNEEKPHDNLNRTIYRNQINKVALAIRDLMEGFTPAGEIVKAPKILSEEKLPRVKIMGKYEKRLIKMSNLKGSFKFSKVAQLFSGMAILLLILSAIFYVHHQSKIRWAYKQALPQIEQLINKNKIAEAFTLTKRAEKYIPFDEKLEKLILLASTKISIITDPPGAEVYVRQYSDTLSEWKRLGITPINNQKIAGGKFYLTATFYTVRLEKKGYENVLAVIGTGKDTLYRKLFEHDSIPDGMVYVDKFWDEITNKTYDIPFFIDRFEVTNKKYKKFMDQGGYRNPVFWKYKFLKEGKEITWKEAMMLFVDKTRRPGPSIWEVGDYPEGEDSFPVGGVSWYEAAAFAEYSGKSLPTGGHWDSGTGWYMHQWRFFSLLENQSNFSNKKSQPVGKNENLTFFGAFDMAGNVREWGFNESATGHVTCGGGWNDYPYRYGPWGQLPSMDRSPQNGFRCVKYLNSKEIPASAYRKVDFAPERDYMTEEPADDKEFSILKSMFFYDKTDLNAKIDFTDQSAEDWTIQKITLDAAYDNDKLIAYLFLPKNASAPYQTLVFFPGSGAHIDQNLTNNQQTNWFLDFMLKSGRAVMYPVYIGTFERNVDIQTNPSEYLRKCILDLRRSIDYLTTRSDIDTLKLGYYGHSWGGRLGGIIPAVEDRIKISILLLGGLSGNKARPLTDNFNYVTRIKIPVLMLNGKYDFSFNFQKSVLPFYKHLGTPDQHKRLVVYDTDHYIPKEEMIKESLDWLDKYFGPVRMK